MSIVSPDDAARTRAPATSGSVAPPASASATGAARATADETDAAASAFEALFVQRMLADMRRAARAGGEPSNAMSNWESMFDERIAALVVERGGLGLAEALSSSLGGAGGAR